MSFRNLLEAGDVDGLRAFWRNASPHTPQPKTRGESEMAMHRARTEAESVSLQARAYSHAWLIERGWPSGLPDHLKPSAQRLYPVIKSGVGVSINARSDYLKPAAAEMQRAVEDAVNDAYADGRTDPAFVSQRMKEAKEKTARQLFGGMG